MDTPIRILIVDDEPKNLTVLETVLDDPSYRLVRAGSADEALRALLAEEFALLILDIRMPGMTGFELASLIKARKKTSGVPIIFLTAYYNEDQHVLAGYDTGAVDYLHKPVNSAVLRSKVAVFAELYRKTSTLESVNRALLTEVAERRHAEDRLRELNESLEQRVAERTEALRDADRRKDEFLATLAHELRNPLAPVRNAVQLLQASGPASTELQWARDVIDRQTRHLTRLIDDLMDVNRISRGRLELKREHVDIVKVIQGAVATSRPQVEAGGNVLNVALPSAPIIVDGDLTRLTQVFLNLLDNAGKYTEGGGRIDLTAEKRGSDVVVSVKDTGIGIPSNQLPLIFEMFSQVEGALSRSRGGLGIGLSLVKRLVAMHGGTVEVRSEGPGKGSEFVVQLPVVADVPSAGHSNEEPAATPRSDLRILVVDDHRDSAATLERLLKLMGNTVRAAYDGEEAVRAAEAFGPHVVICDIGLPKMNGYEVARAIRHAPWGKSIFLIALTGWGQDNDKQKSEEAGFNLHIVKPVDPQSLMKILAGLNAKQPAEPPRT